ncbi:unnamed protein product, partial [Rotaria sordida]
KPSTSILKTTKNDDSSESEDDTKPKKIKTCIK